MGVMNEEELHHSFSRDLKHCLPHPYNDIGLSQTSKDELDEDEQEIEYFEL